MKVLPWPRPRLWAATCPPCSSTRLFTIVRPTPRPPSVRARERSPWVKRSKILGSISGGMPDTIVLDPDDDLLPFTRGRDLDAPSLRGVLGGVAEEIDEHLLQTHGIGLEPLRLGRDQGVDAVASLLGQGTGGFDGLPDRLVGVDGLGSEDDPAARDSRHIQQVIEEPRQLADLPVEDASNPGQAGARIPASRAWRPPP